MEPNPNGRAGRVITVALLAGACLVAAFAFVTAFIVALWGLGLWTPVVFVGAAIVIAAVMYGWHRFAAKFR